MMPDTRSTDVLTMSGDELCRRFCKGRLYDEDLVDLRDATLAAVRRAEPPTERSIAETYTETRTSGPCSGNEVPCWIHLSHEQVRFIHVFARALLAKFGDAPNGTTTTVPVGGPDPKATPHLCRQCRRWFVPTLGMGNVSCCVEHGGGCCHYSETEVPAPQGIAPLTAFDWRFDGR